MTDIELQSELQHSILVSTLLSSYPSFREEDLLIPVLSRVGIFKPPHNELCPQLLLTSSRLQRLH